MSFGGVGGPGAAADVGVHSSFVFGHLQEVLRAFNRGHTQQAVRLVSAADSCVDFEPQLQRIAVESAGKASLLQLQQETEDIREQMMTNVHDLVERGAKLSEIERQSEALAMDTKEIRHQSQKLNWAAMWRHYSVYIVIGALVVGIVLLRILF